MNNVLCISVRQPWAWAIVNRFKPVENRGRTFPQTHVGPFLVHTSKQCTRQEYEAAVETMRKIDASIKVPPLEKLPLQGIVGRARCDRYVTECDSPWFEGPVGLMLSQQKPLPFVKCGGALGWFRCPQDVFEELKRLTARAARAPKAPEKDKPPPRDEFADAF